MSEDYGPLRAFVESVMKHLGTTTTDKQGTSPVVASDPAPQNVSVSGQIAKADDAHRIAYGWASVVSEGGKSIVDKQGHVIEAAEIEKAATEFMQSARLAKAMHDGEQVGEVIHSLPVTQEIAKALSIETPREGWIVAMKFHDDAVWQRVKSGVLAAFSIGGTGNVEQMNAE